MPISSDPDKRARQIAALKPFTSDDARRGRKNAGLSINEWRNELADYAKDEIENVLTDHKAPAAKLIAAREMLQAVGGDFKAVEHVCDYTNHKPLNKSDVTTTEVVHVRRTVIRMPDDRN